MPCGVQCCQQPGCHPYVDKALPDVESQVTQAVESTSSGKSSSSPADKKLHQVRKGFSLLRQPVNVALKQRLPAPSESKSGTNFRNVESLISNVADNRPQNDPGFTQSISQDQVSQLNSLGTELTYSNSKLPSFRQGFEHESYYNQTITNAGQAQGAIDLSRVQFHYETDCGPRIPLCESMGRTVNPPVPQYPNGDVPFNPMMGPNETRVVETPPSFAGIFFTGEPESVGSSQQVFVANYSLLYRWLVQIMTEKDEQGYPYSLNPNRLLSLHEIGRQLPTHCLDHCHYFMIHNPGVTHNHSPHDHEPRTWTDPNSAKSQVFSCNHQ